MRPTVFTTALTATGPQAGVRGRAPAMTKMTMIITRHAGRRRTS